MLMWMMMMIVYMFGIWLFYSVVVTYMCFTYWDSRAILHSVMILHLLLFLLSIGYLPVAIDRPRLEDQWPFWIQGWASCFDSLDFSMIKSTPSDSNYYLRYYLVSRLYPLFLLIVGRVFVQWLSHSKGCIITFVLVH